jgi:hypothetical protein
LAAGGLLAPVARPVDAAGHQLDRGGVDDVDQALEPARHAAVGAPAEARPQRGQAAEHRPEQFFGHGGGADFVGVREAVAAGRGGLAQTPQLGGVQTQAVAY